MLCNIRQSDIKQYTETDKITNTNTQLALVYQFSRAELPMNLTENYFITDECKYYFITIQKPFISRFVKFLFSISIITKTY